MSQIAERSHLYYHQLSGCDSELARPYHQEFSEDQGRESHPESSDWHVTPVPVVTRSLDKNSCIWGGGGVVKMSNRGPSVVKSLFDHLGTCP